MVTTMQPNQELDALVDEHRHWLSSFETQYLRNWKKLYAADYEAAMTEAGVRRLLQRNDVAIEPNENLTGNCGGPDFRCSVGGSRFYVEATCVSIAAMEKKSGIQNEATGFSPINVMGVMEAIFSECVNKARQCRNLDGPALVAVGTFHSVAAMIGLKRALVSTVLTGKTKIARNIDVQTGQQVGDTLPDHGT
jgi:hypothetical protein